MKEFPKSLDSKNKLNFEKMHYDRGLCYLRRELYEHIIHENENNFFDLDKFNNKFLKNSDMLEKMVNIIIKELNDLGWNCKITFGGTALFIYSTDKLPPSCWDGEF